MTIVDVVVLSVICVSALFSLIRGFVKEAVSLTTWIVGIWVSATFASKLAPILPFGIQSEAVNQAAAFAILFLITLIVGSVASHLISQFIKKTGLTGTDKIIGVGFGVLRGFFIVLAFVFIGGMTPLPEYDWWQSSFLLEQFEGLAILVQDYVPSNAKVSFDTIKT